MANFRAPSITVYDLTQSGNLAPVRTISGESTLLLGPQVIAVDSTDNEILVPVEEKVLVFDSLADGNVDPHRVLETTAADGGAQVVVDNVNDELIINDYGSNAINVYSRTASEDDPALRTIKGVNTKLASPVGVAVDPVHNEIIAANNASGMILVFSRNANGNVAPLRTITGPTTTLTSANALFYDSVNDEIFVVDAGNPAILVFSRTANGDVAPIRVIKGPNTLFSVSTGNLVVDTTNNLLYLADYNNQAVYVFPRDGDGDIAPLRVISGPDTQLDNPLGVGLCP